MLNCAHVAALTLCRRGRMVSSEYAAALSDVAGEIVARVLMLGDPKDDDGVSVIGRCTL